MKLLKVTECTQLENSEIYVYIAHLKMHILTPILTPLVQILTGTSRSEPKQAETAVYVYLNVLTPCYYCDLKRRPMCEQVSTKCHQETGRELTSNFSLPLNSEQQKPLPPSLFPVKEASK